MKVVEKQKAIDLRRKGLSYNEIAKEIGVSKGTLNCWLKNVVLTPEQQEHLSEKSKIQGKLGGAKHREIWELKRKEIMDNYNPPFCDPKFMLGLGIYWGEGTKYDLSTTELSNSDPKIVKEFISWIKEFFNDDYDDFTVTIHHYDNDKDEEILDYWSQCINQNKERFKKSQFLISKSSMKKRNTLPYGTAHVRVAGKGVWKVRVKIEKALNLVHSSTG